MNNLFGFLPCPPAIYTNTFSLPTSKILWSIDQLIHILVTLSWSIVFVCIPDVIHLYLAFKNGENSFCLLG